MEKVIVTGADGFIGSNLLKKFDELQTEVWAVIYPKSNTKHRIENLSYVHCVECSLDDLEKHVEDFPDEADAFYHLAWNGVNALARNDMDLQMENIDLCFSCLRFAAKKKVQRFILPGSTSEYLYYGKPINEKAIPSPQDAYGSVKVALRFLAQQYAGQLGIPFIYVVITGIYASDRQDNNVIFYTISELLKGRKPSLTKLEQLWDYVSIKDVVKALALVGEKGRADAFYAIGHGDNWPLSRYIEMIRDYIDVSLPLGIGAVPYRKKELPSSCIDLSAIQEDTGFVPEIDFAEGIKEVIDTMRKELAK